MSKKIEHLGWKAFKKGFFTQWQDKGSKLVQQYPNMDKDQLYNKAYKKLNKKQKRIGEYTFWDEMWNEDEKSRQKRLHGERTLPTDPTQDDSPQSRSQEN
jgi:hypothetical protein